MTSSQDNEAPSAGGPDQAVPTKAKAEAPLNAPSNDTKNATQAPIQQSTSNSNLDSTANPPPTVPPSPAPRASTSDDPQKSAAEKPNGSEKAPAVVAAMSVGNNANGVGASQQQQQAPDNTNDANGNVDVQQWLTHVDFTPDGFDTSASASNALMMGAAGVTDLASMVPAEPFAADSGSMMARTAAILRQMQQMQGLDDFSNGITQPDALYEFDTNPAAVEQMDTVEDEEDEPAFSYPPQAFGCLELPDTIFYITTRTVLIGRDNRVWKTAKDNHMFEERTREAADKGLPPPQRPARSIRRNYQMSFISEEGGALGPASGDEDDERRPAKRRRTANGNRQAVGSSSGAVQNIPGPSSAAAPIVSSRQYLNHTPGSVPVNVESLQPPDDVVARLDIHGPKDNLWTTSKGISRNHLRIEYNPRKRIWEAHVLGRNGFFCGEVLHGAGEVVPLRSGDELQIQTVTMRFTLKGVLDGKTGAEPDSRGTYSENGKEMSFDFQSSRGDEMRDTDDEGNEEELNDRAVVDSSDSDDDDDDVEDSASPANRTLGDDDTGAVDDIMDTVESDPMEGSVRPESAMDEAEKLALLSGLPPKKRGPGRPPKNGIMSKREERLLKKQAQEEAKKNLPPQEPGEQPQKRKVGRPRKHPLPEGADGQPEKRKYKPRKQKGEDGEDDPDGDKPAKEKSQKHKTPPLELRREDFTEEQLQKPTKNYQLLIDEIMSAAPPKGYSLKQVYKRIQERWPYFYFCVDTKGWESSVRHNLLGSDCFQKIDGNWHRMPGVPLESGKKRKPSDSAADSRPTGMYNGYSHTYQPLQHHGHPPMAHSSGLSQPNLPPRYPPNGQAYQIHQGPPPHPPPSNSAQPGGMQHLQGPPRPGYHPQHPPPGAQHPPQPNGFVPTGPPRPQYPGPQQHPPYNPHYANRPPPPPQQSGANHGTPAPGGGPSMAQNPAQRPPVVARPGQGPSPAMPHQQNIQPAPIHPAPAAQQQQLQQQPQPQQQQRPVPLPRPQPGPVRALVPPQPLGPVISPELKQYIRRFREVLMKKLHNKKGKHQAEVIVMSVINRGLGLAHRSLCPGLESIETPLMSVFEQHKKMYPMYCAQIARQAQRAAAAKARPVTGGSGPGPAAPRPALPAPSVAISGPLPAAAQASRPENTAQPSNNATAVVSTSAAPKAPSVQPQMPTSAPAIASTNSVASAPPGPVTTGSTLSLRGGGGSPPPPAATSNASTVAPKPTPAATVTNASASPAVASPRPAVGGTASNTPASASPAVRAVSNTPAATGTATGTPVTAGQSSTAHAAAVSAASVSKTPANAGTPGPASTPVTPADGDEVQLLDPKLIQVVFHFKRYMLPTLETKLGSLVGETLILSAVNRLLGFTDESFVRSTSDVQKADYAQSEKMLMMHLEARFAEYVRNR